MTTCQYETASGHHSSDVTEVWHGTAEPLYLCGYHLGFWADNGGKTV